MVKVFRYVNSHGEEQKQMESRKRDVGGEPGFLFLPKGVSHVAEGYGMEGSDSRDAKRPGTYLPGP